MFPSEWAAELRRVLTSSSLNRRGLKSSGSVTRWSSLKLTVGHAWKRRVSEASSLIPGSGKTKPTMGVRLKSCWTADALVEQKVGWTSEKVVAEVGGEGETKVPNRSSPVCDGYRGLQSVQQRRTRNHQDCLEQLADRWRRICSAACGPAVAASRDGGRGLLANEKTWNEGNESREMGER